jgi:hypothetical protein
MQITTASFWSPAVATSGLAPVSIARRTPPGLPYEWAHLPVLAPRGVEWADDQVLAREFYLDRMDDLGVATVRELLAEVASPGGVTCLCWEWDRDDCHRGWFASWWSDRTGEDVEELPPPSRRRPEQLQMDV